ncbi:type III glutamate--ammonia ligase [Nguyenibacter sp. L1]|uniref:type III glutamate--ammonia ligase n=1 Tax=Nguyenibacter sp. L1 TaxID=3049350 RepID=UPI002B46A03D|nr:type III glutamate--ammonia ligase [Nguyenibacter sp. L1]WRH87132.1 type III glutamate--ammonia ligase [Nguyenibacter sp. L1]
MKSNALSRPSSGASLFDEGKIRDVRYFLISFTDLAGVSRSKLVPISAIDTIQRNGAGFAGFATNLNLSPADPDLVAMPDPASLTVLPWKPDVAWLASDLWMAGQPIEQGPRNTLKRVLGRAAADGLTVMTGVECEFFLISPDGSQVSDPHDDARRPCYDSQALMRRYDVITEICDAIEGMGWQPYQNDHEDANGQYEINWLYDEALVTADRHTFFKFLVRSVAEKHGLRATFMPKPFPHLTGTGCHAHISLWKGAENICRGRDDDAYGLGLSREGYHFVGGLIEHAPALCLLFNPTVNSYKRINAPRTVSGATWAPNAVTYAGDNRTHMIRVPGGGRFEMRLPDGAANPYLLQAGLAAAGLEGVRSQRDPGAPLAINMYTDGHSVRALKKLPLNLVDAIREFRNSTVLHRELGKDLADSYLWQKEAEWADYCAHLSDWERATTLDC